MKRWIIFLLILIILPIAPARADTIKWVDFAVPYESLRYAMYADIETAENEKHIDWIDALALAGCRTGGKCGLSYVNKAVKELQGNQSAEELLGGLYKYYNYYHEAYTAVLGGILGSFSV